MSTDKITQTETLTSQPITFRKTTSKLHLMLLLLSFCIIGYAIGLKYTPNSMPFSNSNERTDFYAPHAGYCVPELEF